MTIARPKLSKGIKLIFGGIQLLALAALNATIYWRKNADYPAFCNNWQQKEFLITYCCSTPPEEKLLKQAAREHFNMVPCSEEALKYAPKYKLSVMLEHGLLAASTMNAIRSRTFRP
ncbi:MAG: hypothetical protein KGS72_26160 [Cyanobacteria bacterium REEB67]|nr:hypothetical protein [Cyanobacteria bacterium REEB67]